MSWKRKPRTPPPPPPPDIRSVEAVYNNWHSGEVCRWTFQYTVTPNPPQGGMKKVFFSTDGKWAVGFFHDPTLVEAKGIRDRLKAILGRFNPTRSEQDGGAFGNDEERASYFRNLFCWPVATVEDPEFGFGIVSPRYPQKFLMGENVSPNAGLSNLWKGLDKKTTWFSSDSLRGKLKERELGDFRSTLHICFSIARSVERLHIAGLAHSDLSCNNVLVDPVTGSSIVIDIDSLVVPDLYPPEVAGTKGYIAPEVLETLSLPVGDPLKKSPCRYTDLYAMAVIFYELLLHRHPLDGPKKYQVDDPEEEDRLIYGSNALFIEDPDDRSNRPKNLDVTIQDLGPKLEALFVRAFSAGLHKPVLRPDAVNWVDALSESMDLLQRCDNSNCPMGWFILYNPERPVCPFCHTRADRKKLIRMVSYRPARGRKGQWAKWGQEVNLYEGKKLHRRHFDPFAAREAREAPECAATVESRNGSLFLVNHALPDLALASGEPVPEGEGIALGDGVWLCTSRNVDTWNADTLLLEIIGGERAAGPVIGGGNPPGEAAAQRR